MPEKNSGLTRVYKAFFYSMNGLTAAFRHEAAFRQELIVALVLVPLTIWLPVSHMERVIMVSTVMLVLIIELLNSGIEATVDRISEEHHELAGRAKDMGSAAVLLSLMLWAYVWSSILFF